MVVVTLIFGLSILLQFTAVILAFRLIRTTGWHVAWSFIAIGLLLMGIRRSISFVNLLEKGLPPSSYTPELVALTISALMVVGVALIGPMFTARQRAERALQESEANLRALTENINDGILVNVDGQHVFANRRMGEMLGYTVDEMIQTRLHDVVHPSDYSMVSDRYQRRLAGEEVPIQYETVYQCKDGLSLPVEITAARTIWHGQPGALVAVRDISERRKAEQALHATQNELRRAHNELEERVNRRTIELARARDDAQKANHAKSEFLSRMSHELRTPLNSILGFSQLLKHDSNTLMTAEQQDFIEEIMEAGKHLLGLINEVLDLAKIESGHVDLTFEPVSVHAVIDTCHKLIQPMASERNITINCSDSGCQFLQVKVDHIRFRQVILNLLSNAVKYNNEGGQVDIGCDLEEGQYACIRIQDTGSGIPLDKQVALFEPFDRLGAEQSGVEGSGIGLVITRHLVELMHGDMGLESEVGKGTTFWIKLPLAERPTASEDMQPAEDERDELTSSSGKQKPRYRVLYVEDNLANQKLVGEILKRYQDIDMLTTESAEKGLELAVTQQPDFILLDINLPGMNGFECVAQLKAREQTSQIPVVAVSANAMPEDIARGMAAGFSAYVTKPVNVQQLFQTIDGIVDSLDSRQRMSTFTRIN